MLDGVLLGASEERLKATMVTDGSLCNNSLLVVLVGDKAKMLVLRVDEV